MEQTILQKIEKLLTDTKRDGIEILVSSMETNGFFEAPCSGGNHLAVKGGLAEHSLNVYQNMMSLNEALGSGFSEETIIICSILHDLGKIGDFGKPNYVPNMVDSRKKDENGEKIYKQSEAKPFSTNKELLYVPHEVRSISIASQFIDLTEEEYFAILYHNGLYGDFKYDISGKETPLYLLLHFADMWCSRVVEEKEIQPE